MRKRLIFGPEDRAVYARKQAAREADQRLVDAGIATALEISRENAIATSVIHMYQPAPIAAPARRRRRAP